MKSNIKVTLANRRLAQPHNAYNIYFILERYKLIHEMEWSCGTGAVQHHPQISYDLAGYDFLTLPDLPPPYQNLQLPLGWFVPGKNSKRKHRKTHGCELFDIDAAIFARSLLSALFCHFRPSRHHMTVTSFAELARTVAANWKSADKETKEYCVEVARILKKRHTELTKVGGLICLSPIDSVSPGPTEEAKPRNFDNETKDTELTKFGAVFCLPGMDSASPGPKNETNQQKGVHGPAIISPVACEQCTVNIQDTVNSRDRSRTWLKDMIHQYQHNQAATIPNTTALWVNDGLNRTTFNMLQPMPSGVIQETIRTESMQTMTGSPVSQAGTDHQYVEQEKFRAIINASQRASISNMMTLPGRAPMPEGIRCFGERPSLNNSRYSATERQNHSDLDRSTATYNIQELNVDDSDILDMWHSTMPSDVIQDMQLMAGSARIQTGTYHQEVTQEFRAVMNASRRATISSMMTLPGRALMNPLLRRYSAPECRSFKERHTELTPPPIDPGRKGTLTFCPQT